MKELFTVIVTGQLLFLAICVQMQGKTCPKGWFGYPSCKYKCHCAINSQCDDKGNCSGGCDKGWFGPACQYADLVALHSSNNMPAWLYDSNDSTCNTDKTKQNWTIELTNAFPITWIRLSFNKNDWWDTSQISLEFRKNSESRPIACINERQFAPTNQTLDIYCDQEETVQQVNIQGSEVQSLCSVYVSGGRNVALKQSTSQSSKHETQNSSLAVDGTTKKTYKHCTHTSETNDKNPTWTVNFLSPVQINRYVLYNRREFVKGQKTECCPERLKSFILTSFNETNSPVFNYIEPDQVLDVYTVISAGDISPLHKVSIRATAIVDYYWKTYPNPILTLCEVEMYGDSVCNTSHYGRECENPCNCYNNEKCFVSTGGCPNKCIEGYYGEACSQELEDESLSVVAIVAPIVAALVIAVLIALGVILWRQHQQKKESNIDTAPIQNEGRSRPYETVSEVEDTQSLETTETEPVKSVDDAAEKPKPSVKPKPSDNKVKQFKLLGTKHDSEKTKDKKGDLYYNILTGLSATAIDAEKFDAFIDSHKKTFFQSEFSEIPGNTNATTTIAESSEHRMKNRYKNICAYDHSRVHLIENTTKNQGGYINASYVQGYNDKERFIASQGPTQVILEDFVRMLWEQDIEQVVMLTNLIEMGTMKCERYWPEDGEITIGEITVRLNTTQVFADYTIRRLQLMNSNELMKTLTQFHFTTWPDKLVPTTPWGLVDFEQRVTTSSNSKPIVVHCSAGVGRTGTFIALRNLIKEAEDTGYMDFFTAVQKLRVDRMNMVQTAEQYEFLHKAAQVALVCRKTTVTSSNIAYRIKELGKVSKKKGQTNMEKEFKAICNVCEDKNDTDQPESVDDSLNVYENSRTVANKDKNRLSNILPKDCYRVILNCESEELEDYINAVYVPSFVKHDQQILTQLPLPTTVTDFWRMVTQYRVKLIVAFDMEHKEKDLTLGVYLPEEENKKAEFLHLNVEAIPVSRGHFWEQKQLLVTIDNERKAYVNPDNGHRITHLKCTKEDLSTSELLALAKEIRAKRPVGDCRIVYMCRNGADYSGLICVLMLLLDRIDNDHRLTVPLVVGAIKAIRPEVIPTLDQYNTLYQALKLYNELSNEYCNFGETSTV